MTLSIYSSSTRIVQGSDSPCRLTMNMKTLKSMSEKAYCSKVSRTYKLRNIMGNTDTIWSFLSRKKARNIDSVYKVEMKHELYWPAPLGWPAQCLLWLASWTPFPPASWGPDGGNRVKTHFTARWRGHTNTTAEAHCTCSASWKVTGFMSQQVLTRADKKHVIHWIEMSVVSADYSG